MSEEAAEENGRTRKAVSKAKININGHSKFRFCGTFCLRANIIKNDKLAFDIVYMEQE